MIFSDQHFTWSLQIICNDVLSLHTSHLRSPAHSLTHRSKWSAEGERKENSILLGEAPRNQSFTTKIIAAKHKPPCPSKSPLFFPDLRWRTSTLLNLLMHPHRFYRASQHPWGFTVSLVCSLCLLFSLGGSLRHRVYLAACWAPSFPTSKGGLGEVLCMPCFCGPEPGQEARHSSCTCADAAWGCHGVSHRPWAWPILTNTTVKTAGKSEFLLKT